MYLFDFKRAEATATVGPVLGLLHPITHTGGSFSHVNEVFLPAGETHEGVSVAAPGAADFSGEWLATRTVCITRRSLPGCDLGGCSRWAPG